MRRRDMIRKNYLIVFMLGIMTLMAVGYSAFSSQLDIKGTSSISTKWKVVITNIKLEKLTGMATEESDVTFSELNASMNVNFKSPGDSAKYAITVSNEGTLNAALDYIKINMNDSSILKSKIEDISSGDVLKSGDSKTFYVTITYDENVTTSVGNKTFDITADLNFVQEGSKTEFSGADAPSIDNLSIAGISLTPEENRINVRVSATDAVNYYYSYDNDKWYTSMNDNYILTDLTPNTNYTIYVKAEDKDGNVVVSTSTTKTIDTTKPTIKIEEKEIIQGNNNWNKAVTLTNTVTDNDKIKTFLYCVTTDETCTPTKEATLSDDNTFNYVFDGSSSEQKLCFKATDRVGNSTEQCSDSYLVDNVDPTVNSVTVTPDDDTMTVEVNASDKDSGLNTYYYSKDGGQTYTSSENANYTFTSLSEGEYIVNVYVQDKAGNTSSTKAGTTAIKHKSYCEKNGITDLGDCVIASEAKDTDITSAKSTIKAKGTPSFTSTSPKLSYSEKAATSLSTWSTTLSDVYIGTGYTFNTNTGMYQITGGSTVEPGNLDYTSTTYYTLGQNWNTIASTMYKISSVSASTNSTTGTKTYTFTKYNYTQNMASYDTKDVGMYAGTDNDGDTYYYRGSVGGNYVKFANKYWRIIRVNGDGSVRMIYDGSSAHPNGESTSDRQVGTRAFNSYINDNAYVGYMYGDESNFVQTDSGDLTFNYTGLSSTSKYYFGTSYTFDKSTKSYKVSGDLISGTLATDKVGYYTCFDTNKNNSCQRLFYTKKYVSSSSMTVSGKGYGSTSKEGAFAKVTNSTIKTYLDSWYDSNLSSYTDKFSKNTTYCNNKNISTLQSGTYKNTGYGITPTIYGYERFWNWGGSPKGPTLLCNSDDEYSISNGSLTKAIGLITADEVNMAGGMAGAMNSLYYLYSGTNYWTMSPSRFDHWQTSYGLFISVSGAIDFFSMHSWYGVRPVLNLNTDNLTFTGTGTKEDPYVVS